jgi:hypothetical protein
MSSPKMVSSRASCPAFTVRTNGESGIRQLSRKLLDLIFEADTSAIGRRCSVLAVYPPAASEPEARSSGVIGYHYQRRIGPPKG